MARTLKAYVTSIGFFDLAVAAPSMKAASEAWGSGRKLFDWGFAKETDDPAIVAATMAKPGVVLKRPVGSTGAFNEHAALPKVLPVEAAAKPGRPEKRTAQEMPPRKADDEAVRKAAVAFEREQKRRERERRIEDAAREKERRQRERARAKSAAALEKATARHDEIMKQIASERDALDRRAEAENTRWENEREKLKAALRADPGTH